MSIHFAQLPPDVRELFEREFGFVSTAVADAAGISRNRLYMLAKAGGLTRLARGQYAVTSLVADLDEWQLFRFRAAEFARATPDSYITGWAATSIWELPTLGKPPSVPTVVRPRGRGHNPSISKSGRILVADLPDAHLQHLGVLGVVSKAWAVVDLARTARLPDALVVADAAVREGVDLNEALPHMVRWKGANRARWVVAHADPAAETPLETLARFTFIEQSLPMPVINAWIGANEPEKRVDGLLPWHWCAYEADGATKYDNRSDASQIVRAQNDREFYLRRLGLDFIRFGWDDVYGDRAPLANRVRALLRDNPIRPEPVRWWKNVPGVGPVEPRPEDWPSQVPSGLILPAGWDKELDGLR